MGTHQSTAMNGLRSLCVAAHYVLLFELLGCWALGMLPNSENWYDNTNIICNQKIKTTIS